MLYSYPPLPISRTIDFKDLSAYTQKVFGDQEFVKGFVKGKRLIADLADKNDVCLHYMYLKELVKLGVQVKIKNVIVSEQAPFMRAFVDDRKKRRDEARDDFTSLLQKFVVNSIYGKVIEK